MHRKPSIVPTLLLLVALLLTLEMWLSECDRTRALNAEIERLTNANKIQGTQGTQGLLGSGP